jgi:hypothetical protein
VVAPQFKLKVQPLLIVPGHYRLKKWFHWGRSSLKTEWIKSETTKIGIRMEQKVSKTEVKEIQVWKSFPLYRAWHA